MSSTLRSRLDALAVEKRVLTVEEISQVDSAAEVLSLLPVLAREKCYAVDILSEGMVEALLLKADEFGIDFREHLHQSHASSLGRMVFDGVLSPEATRQVVEVSMNATYVTAGIGNGLYDGHQEEVIQMMTSHFGGGWKEGQLVAAYIERYGFDAQIETVFNSLPQGIYFGNALGIAAPYITNEKVMMKYLERGKWEILPNEKVTVNMILNAALTYERLEHYTGLAEALKKHSRFSTLTEAFREAEAAPRPLIRGDAHDRDKQELTRLRQRARQYSIAVGAVKKQETFVNSFEVPYRKLHESVLRAEARGRYQRCELLRGKIQNVDDSLALQAYQDKVEALLNAQNM